MRGQRFTKSSPCPICRGYQAMPRDRGIRCAGYVMADGTAVVCTRVAEGAVKEISTATGPGYIHRLEQPKAHVAPATKAKRSYVTPDAAVEAICRREKATLVAFWVYYRMDGSEAFRVLRLDLGGGKKSYRPIHPVDGRWYEGDPAGLLPLYALLRLKGAGRIYVTEGEKAAAAAESIGLTATTSAHGAHSAAKTDWSPLAGCEVIVLPDNDPDGEKYKDKVVEILTGLTPPAKVRVVPLPDLPPDGGDIVEFLESRESQDPEAIKAFIDQLADAAPVVTPPTSMGLFDGVEAAANPPAGPASEAPETEAKDEVEDKNAAAAASQTDRLVDLVLTAELFHSADGDDETYALVRGDGVSRTMPIKSSRFRLWLMNLFRRTYHTSPNSNSVKQAIELAKAAAIEEGQPQQVHVRIAAGPGDTILLDLGDASGRAIEINAQGWQIVAQPAVRFIRPRGLLALPEPVRGGDINELRQFVNFGTDGDFLLEVLWLISAIRPHGPFPVLIVRGEQGCAKSTTCKVLRMIIDPNKAPLRPAPRNERDLMIAASNSWPQCFDNMSGIKASLSDALCRLATGAGFGTRQLFTDDDEKLMSACRPIISNGIDNTGLRSDLLDRAICLNLPPLPEEKRRPEAVLWAAFREAHPRILGAALDVVSSALRNLHAVNIDRPPRMADFALWAAAASPALGSSAEEFLAIYYEKRGEADIDAVESHPIGRCILQLVETLGTWIGTSEDLLAYALERGERLDWQRSPRWVAAQIQRLAPNLRRMGFSIDRPPREGGTGRRLYTIRRVPQTATTVTSSPPAGDDGQPQAQLPAENCDGSDGCDGVEGGVA